MKTIERKRTGAQCDRILARLRRYPRVSNKALSRIALKYTSRISDLRNDGFNIRIQSRNYRTGLTWYRLAK